MAPTGTRTIVWSNGEDAFCIAQVGSILALEEKCGAGIAEIMYRLTAGTWRLNDVRETIRLGLIGGGMKPDKAMAAVKLHVDAAPLAQSVMVAFAVLEAAMVGVPDDPVGKDQEPEDQTTATAASGAPSSTAKAPPSDSRPAT